jgi:hypothetical protein
MTTALITRALRKSDLVEYKILERDRYKKIISEQQGWCLDRRGDYAVIRHTDLNHVGEWQFTHAERTTDRFEEFTQWLADVTSIFAGAGLDFEVVMAEVRFGRLHQHTAQVVKEVRVSIVNSKGVGQ